MQLWERPKTITQLRAFLGCCNYYHEFVPLYAKYSGPLTELLKVGKIEGRKGSQVKVKWTPECEEAFTGLKEALANVVTLKTPWLDGRPFIFVQTPVVTPLVLRSNKSMTKVTIILWLSGLAGLQQDSQIKVQGSKKPTQSFVPYGVMKVGSWAIALRY